MATLVLGAVGTLVAGPFGAAIGAMIGNRVDQMIFAPKGREGPRLQDLKVQASTYGQAIPKIFGTMRVAGCVIWASDLMEHRSTSGGGKGRPEVTQFQYSAHLAVALSSRPLQAVQRIWADGNLLRGASGRLYEAGEMRFYEGREDQAVDPLIASAVGVASASAFRGLSYIVFENLDLTAFGNRIPSLTFEVVADAGPVDGGQIGNALLGQAERCAGVWPIAGYAASGTRMRDALEPLFSVDQTGVIQAGDDWRLAPPQVTGEAAALGSFSRIGRTAADGDVVERRRQSLSAMPSQIRLRHYEPERDYQAGQQMSLVAGGGARDELVDLPAVLSAASARSLAAWLAAAASDGRETLRWRGDFAALALPVGGLVRMDDGALWRVQARSVTANDIFVDLVRHERRTPPHLPVAPGEAVPAPIWTDAGGVVRIFDLPNGNNVAAHAPNIMVAGAGYGSPWRGADLFFRADAEAEPVALGRVKAVAAMGVLAEPLPVGCELLRDDRFTLIVQLDHDEMALLSVDAAALMRGANRCVVGGEVMQFASAALVGGEGADGRMWKLSGLLRGQGGKATAHAVGAPFLLLDDAAALLLPEAAAMSALNGHATLQWRERGSEAIQSAIVLADGQALRPLAPVHGRALALPDGGWKLSWVRRSRVDTGWRDQVDMPLGEARERWLVHLVASSGRELLGEVTTSEIMVDAERLSEVMLPMVAEIVQIGDHGLSSPLIISLG